MYTQFSLNFIIKLLNLSRALGFSPFVWNKEKKIFEVSFSAYVRTFISVQHVTSYILLVVPYNILLIREAHDYAELTYTIVVFLCSLLGGLLVILAEFWFEACCTLGNSLLRYLDYFKDNYMARNYQYKKSTIVLDRFVNISIVISSIVIISCGLLITGHYFLYPKSGPYLTYQIPDMYFFTWIYICTGILFTVPAVGISSLVSIMVSGAILVLAYARPIYSTELRLGLHPEKYKTLIKLRHPNHLIKNWRAIELFLRYACLNFGFTLVPLQIVFTKLALFCNVTLILFSKDLPATSKIVLPMISFTCTVGWMLFLTFSGKLYVSSKATLRSWKPQTWSASDEERKFLRKFKKGCQPLSVSAGKYFVIRPKSSLNFLRGVSRGTFRSLCTFKRMS